MLRLSFLSSRPALRKAYPDPRCLRSLHENAVLKKKQDPTAPEDLSPRDKKLLRLEKFREFTPDYGLEALRVPEESLSHVYEQVRSKHQPAFLTPENETPKAEVVPPKKKERPSRKQVRIEDGSVTAEAGVQAPKRTRRRKANAKDSSGSIDADAEAPKKARARKIKDAESDPDIEEPGVVVPKKTTQRSAPKRPEQEYDENVNVEDAKRGRPFRKPPPVEEIPEEEIADLPPLQKEVLQQLRTNWSRNRNNALGDVRRVNVIGEDLCDSILERLKPSLAKHEGCDIVDVNPGPGIWSSRLHNILKPRTHILMEPDTKMYQPLLQPLLDAPNSKYVLYPKPGVIWAHLEKVLSSENLPFQEPLPVNDPRLDKPNNTLLFVANLSYNPKRTFKSFPSLTVLVLHQLMSAVRSHALIHKYGTVRMLIWLVDDERLTSLPRHMALRKKSAIEAEISCGQIDEIASTTRAIGTFRREDDLEIESAMQVLEKMKKAGIQTPEGRESEMQLHIEGGDVDAATASFREGDDRRGNMKFRELALLEEQYAAGDFEKYSTIARPETTKKSKKPRAKFEFTPEYERLTKLRYRVATTHNRGNALSDFVSRNEEIMDMQKELWGGSGPEHEARCEEVMRRIQEFKDDIEKLPGPELRVNILTYLDNQRLLKQETPALMYDRRQFEPLKVRPMDFFPRTELALLDFQPQTLWPVLREDFPASYDVFEYIITVLFSHPGHSVVTGLKLLWPGAYEWLVPECPTLKNPFKGGDMDLNRLTVRCMTHEMLREIIESWMRWPWRPDRMELLGRHTIYEGAEDVHQPMGGDGEALP